MRLLYFWKTINRIPENSLRIINQLFFYLFLIRKKPLRYSQKILKEIEKNAPESMKGIYKRAEAEKAIIARVEKEKGKKV